MRKGMRCDLSFLGDRLRDQKWFKFHYLASILITWFINIKNNRRSS